MKKSAKSARSKELADLQLKVRYQDVAALKPYAGNARTHSDKQITQIAASIRNFGFNNPVLVDADNRIIAGHGRVEAAKRLGLTSVPTIRLDHLSDAERRAYVIADNRLAELAGWDREILEIELQALAGLDLDFDVEITGFDTAELDFLLDDRVEATRPDRGRRDSAGRLGPLDHATWRSLAAGRASPPVRRCPGWRGGSTAHGEETRPDGVHRSTLQREDRRPRRRRGQDQAPRVRHGLRRDDAGSSSPGS